MDFSDYKFICKTVQSNTIKTLFEALKDILDDVNILITKQSIEILTVDPNKCCIVHLKLVEENFELYHCVCEFNIGVNMKNLFLLLKTVGNNDVITFSVTKSCDTRLNITIENKDKNMKDTSKLKLLDFNFDRYEVPDIKFDSVVKIPSNDFQKICKDLSNIGESVRVVTRQNQFIMYVDGDIGEKEIVLEDTNEGEEDSIELKSNRIQIKQITNKTISQMFALKYLLSFIKSSNLCSILEIVIIEDKPLILIYSAGSLGSLKFLLSPLEQPDDE